MFYFSLVIILMIQARTKKEKDISQKQGKKRKERKLILSKFMKISELTQKFFRVDYTISQAKSISTTNDNLVGLRQNDVEETYL